MSTEIGDIENALSFESKVSKKFGIEQQV